MKKNRVKQRMVQSTRRRHVRKASRNELMRELFATKDNQTLISSYIDSNNIADIFASAGKILTFGPSNTKVVTKGTAKVRGRSVVILEVLESGEFTDLTHDVDGQIVYEKEELAVDGNGTLVGIKSDPHTAITPSELIEDLIDQLEFAKSKFNSSNYEELLKATIDSAIRLNTVNDHGDQYGNRDRAIIRDYLADF